MKGIERGPVIASPPGNGVAAARTARAAGTLAVHAAGSLRSVFNAIGGAFVAEYPGQAVRLDFGPSGLLRERLLKSPGGGVFASANMAHPEELLRAGRAGPVRPFARNGLCAVVRPDRVERSGIAGARAWLEAKALQLVGGPTAPAPDALSRSAYAAILGSGQADIVLTYRTNAAQALRENSRLRFVAVPPEIQVGVQYGVTVLSGSAAPAWEFVDFLLGERGQALLAAEGFDAP